VTPAGYGPDESAESAPQGETTEERRTLNSIAEAQTLLRGRMPDDKRAAIERQVERDREKLEHLRIAKRSAADESAVAVPTVEPVVQPAKTMWKAPTRDTLPAEASARPTPEATGGNLPVAQDTTEGAALVAQPETPVAPEQAGIETPATPAEAQDAPAQLREIAEQASRGPVARRNVVTYAPAAERETRVFAEIGLDVAGYSHIVDSDAVRHVFKRHGDAGIEGARGQLPVTPGDIALIPEIVAAPDSIEAVGKTNIGREGIRYRKRIGANYVVVEEARTGQRQLAFVTMWKVPAAPDAPAGQSSALTSETFGQSLPTGEIVPAPESPDNTSPTGGSGEAANDANRSTSTKNAITDAERASAGQDPVLREVAQTNESTLAEARATLAENPSRGAEVVARLRSEGASGISLADEAVLLVEKVRLRNQRDAAANRASDPSLDDEVRLVAKREWEDAEARINEMDQATHASGAEWGRLGQFRQRMLREDFTFEALERKERVREGRPLTVEESAKLKEFAARVEVLEREAEVARQKLEAAETEAGAAAAYKNLVKEMAAALHGEPKGKPRLDKLKAAADESRKALLGMLGRTNAGIDPTAFFHLSRIGAFHIANGALKFADWVGRMKADLGAKLFGEAEPALPDVYAAAKALGKGVTGKTPAIVVAGIDAKAITHRDVVELARAHILAGVKGEGPVMAAVHADLLKLDPAITERDVRRLFSEYGKVQFPSQAVDRVALRELRALVQLQESIDRLQAGLDALKSGPQRDKATQAVREKRKALDALLRQQEKSNAPSPEKLATYQQARAENLRHQIEDLEKQLATGERPPEKGKPAPPTPEVQKLTAERDALRKQLDAIDRNDAKNESAKVALRKQLEAVNERLAGKVKPEPERVAGPDDEETTRLKAQLAKSRELLADKNQQAARRKELEDRIEALLQRLAGKQKEAKAARQIADAETADLQRIRDQLADQLRQLESPRLSPEERYQRGRAASLRKQLADVEARLQAGDYEHRTRPAPRDLDTANTAAALRLAKVKEEFYRRQFEADMAKRHPLKKILGGIGETLNLARSILTSVDLSAVLRQGGFIAFGHPVRASTSIVPMLKAFASEAHQFAVEKEIAQRPNAPLYKKYGMEITESGGTSISKMEEAFLSRWLDKLPNGALGAALGAGVGGLIGGPVGAGVGAVAGVRFGGIVRGSGRAYVTFMNKLRADSFDAMYYALSTDGKLTQEEGEAIANYINVATGRGIILTDRVTQSSAIANVAFFAPRLVASRFNLLFGQPLY
ncbi:MAG: hypothetical protein ACREO3_10995, partial [Arenimonas sp.]